MRLTSLASDNVKAILSGRASEVGLPALMTPFPLEWVEQSTPSYNRSSPNSQALRLAVYHLTGAAEPAQPHRATADRARGAHVQERVGQCEAAFDGALTEHVVVFVA